ncbi:MAG: hypothetical protein AB7S59_09165 [Parvibaculaceae bacterium]
MFAFIATGVGWSATGALKGVASHHDNEIALADDHSPDHHPADRMAKLDQSCPSGDDCSNTASHEEPGDSCCATACHIATEASAPDQAFLAIFVSLQGIAPNDDTKEAVAARLERPPRPIAA